MPHYNIDQFVNVENDSYKPTRRMSFAESGSDISERVALALGSKAYSENSSLDISSIAGAMNSSQGYVTYPDESDDWSTDTNGNHVESNPYQSSFLDVKLIDDVIKMLEDSRESFDKKTLIDCYDTAVRRQADLPEGLEMGDDLYKMIEDSIKQHIWHERSFQTRLGVTREEIARRFTLKMYFNKSWKPYWAKDYTGPVVHVAPAIQVKPIEPSMPAAPVVNVAPACGICKSSGPFDEYPEGYDPNDYDDEPSNCASDIIPAEQETVKENMNEGSNLEKLYDLLNSHIPGFVPLDPATADVGVVNTYKLPEEEEADKQLDESESASREKHSLNAAAFAWVNFTEEQRKEYGCICEGIINKLNDGNTVRTKIVEELKKFKNKIACKVKVWDIDYDSKNGFIRKGPYSKTKTPPKFTLLKGDGIIEDGVIMRYYLQTFYTGVIPEYREIQSKRMKAHWEEKRECDNMLKIIEDVIANDMTYSDCSEKYNKRTADEIYDKRPEVFRTTRKGFAENQKRIHEKQMRGEKLTANDMNAKSYCKKNKPELYKQIYG